MFDRFVSLPFAQISFCEKENSSFWNHALIDEVLYGNQIKEVEDEMKTLNRKSAFYFDNRKNMQEMVDRLKKIEYEFDFEDSWMFHAGDNIEGYEYNKIKEVLNSDDLDIFLQTFDKCYRKNDSQNPYGELGSYLEVAKDAWRNHHDSKRIEYFIAYDKNKPVAVSTLTNYKGIGYISNVGSLQSVRGPC